MVDSRVDELLLKLAKLDPTTWERFKEYDIFQKDDARREWTLQGVIQDAIKVKNKDESDIMKWWRCNTYSPGPTEPNWLAEVYVWGKWGYLGDGDTPAEAILDAFTKALEAEAP